MKLGMFGQLTVMAVSYIALVSDTQATSLAAASPDHGSLTQHDSQLAMAHLGANLLAQTGTQALQMGDIMNVDKMQDFGNVFSVLRQSKPA